jgi:death-on-curing protein
MDEVIFLKWDEVLAIHRRQLELFGGQDGFLDKGVVESAIAQPQSTMFGQYLHDDIAHMAAAYLFHLATTQGFLDGNKRTALNCAAVFLRINGYALDVTNDAIYPVALAVATNEMDKNELADWFREHIAQTIE